MARYVVPGVVLLALVGGYVAGQQPQPSEPGPVPQRAPDPLPRRCVGVAATIHPTAGTQTIYRAFDDGAVEKIIDARGGKWVVVAPRP